MRLTALTIAVVMGLAGITWAADPAAGPNIPKDARWTIYCTTIATPDHLGQAKSLQAYLSKNTNLRDWYLVQGEGQTSFYYGFYREIDEHIDKREAQRAHEDVRTIAGLISPNTGGRMFNGVFLMTMESADPAAPPEWNLANAKGAYTLEVGVYKDSPERKAAAVQAVREARAAGIEAYYYHGTTASSVCIGAWPEEAVRKEAEVKSHDPNAVAVLVPDSMPMPDKPLTTTDGKRVEALQAKVRVVDPTLLEAMRRWPDHGVNGPPVQNRKVRDPQTGVVRVVHDSSVVVVIPHTGNTAAPAPARNSLYLPPPAMDTAPVENKATPPPDPWRATRPPLPASKGGKLKSLED